MEHAAGVKKGALSRRRQYPRSASVLVAVSVALSSAVLSACSAPTSGGAVHTANATPSTSSGVKGAPPLETAGGLSLPLEQYLVRTSETHQINLAHLVLTKRCMARFGFAYATPSTMSTMQYDSDATNMSRRYGISDAQIAARWGYEVPGANAPLNQTSDVRSLSDAEYEVLYGHAKTSNTSAVPSLPNGEAIPKGGCKGEANALFAQHTPAGATDIAGQLDTQSFYESQSASEVVAAIAAWSRCMAADGYDFKTPFDATTAYAGSTSPSPQEIKVALSDIECKKKTHLLSTWDSVESAIQNQLIARNQLALNSELQAETQAVKYAESLIS